MATSPAADGCAASGDIGAGGDLVEETRGLFGDLGLAIAIAQLEMISKRWLAPITDVAETSYCQRDPRIKNCPYATGLSMVVGCLSLHKQAGGLY